MIDLNKKTYSNCICFSFEGCHDPLWGCGWFDRMRAGGIHSLSSLMLNIPAIFAAGRTILFARILHLVIDGDKLFYSFGIDASKDELQQLR